MIILRTYEQREFARRDYEGLTEAQQRVLKRRRSKYARDLNRMRNDRSAENIKKILQDNGWNNIQTTDVVEGGGIKSTLKTNTGSNSLDNYDTVSRRASNNIRKEALEQSSKAKKIMRDGLERGWYDDEVKSVERAQERLKNMKANKAAREAAEKVAKKGFKLGKGGKIALGAGAALVGGTLAYKHYKNKSKR